MKIDEFVAYLKEVQERTGATEIVFVSVCRPSVHPDVTDVCTLEHVYFNPRSRHPNTMKFYSDPRGGKKEVRAIWLLPF